MIPTFKIYDSTATSLLYTFPYVQYTNAPRTVKKVVELQNIRGQGSLIIEGGQDTWDLELRFVIVGDGYEDITAQIDALESAIAFNTPYQLTIDKTGSTVYQYKVKRVTPFVYQDSLRTRIQRVTAVFKVNSWA